MTEHARRYVLSLFGAMLLATSPVMAQRGHDPFLIAGPDYGVALTPDVYFVNFLFMYWSNPHNAANMPAYRAPIPRAFANCLLQHPEGCRYADYQQFFNGRTSCRNGNLGDTCRWTSECQLEPSLERLAPPEFNSANQINNPLGITHATRLARSLGIDEDFVLTPDQYQCLIGTPGQRSTDQDTIVACIGELTNSNGVTDIPLSSYGLALDNPGQGSGSLVRSVCAPQAPCLRMNKVLEGPLELIAAQCGFPEKLGKLSVQTQLLQFAIRGNVCQSSSITNSGGACLAQSIRLR